MKKVVACLETVKDLAVSAIAVFGAVEALNAAVNDFVNKIKRSLSSK